VKCLPPENKPEPAEIKTCNRYLADELRSSPGCVCCWRSGLVAHKAVLMALGLKQSARFRLRPWLRAMSCRMVGS
jgi:uracil-DNA glycosylase